LQLIDIVQLSVFIFSALVLFILVISYTSYRIRTVIKKNTPGKDKTEPLTVPEVKKSGLEDFGFEHREHQKLIHKKRMEKFQVFNPALSKTDSIKSQSNKIDRSKSVTPQKHFPRIITIDSVR
jgi:hypothetical protein